MKTLKSALAAIIILFTSVAVSNAAVKPGQPSQNDVVSIYVNSVNGGKSAEVEKFLDDDLQFNVHHGDNVSTLNKTQLVNFLNDNSSSNTPASTNVTVLQQDDQSAKIKVDFKYDGYTRSDVVTLFKSSGWKITAVDSTSK